MTTAVDAIINGGIKKGIKIDFKTIDVVEDSMKIVEQFEVKSCLLLQSYLEIASITLDFN